MALKRINFEQLQAVATENPTAWHHLIAAGVFDPSLTFLNIDEAVEKQIFAGKPLPRPLDSPVPPASSAIFKTRSPAEIEHIQAICAECPWNINWVCEHLGCKTCQQRRSGGLKNYFVDPKFKCPAHKWS